MPPDAAAMSAPEAVPAHRPTTVGPGLELGLWLGLELELIRAEAK